MRLLERKGLGKNPPFHIRWRSNENWLPRSLLLHVCLRISALINSSRDVYLCLSLTAQAVFIFCLFKPFLSYSTCSIFLLFLLYKQRMSADFTLSSPVDTLWHFSIWPVLWQVTVPSVLPLGLCLSALLARVSTLHWGSYL